MHRPHDVSEADLVAFADGELRGARREVVEAHVQACRRCRERLAAFRASASLVSAATPLVDHPVVVAMVRARLDEAERGGAFPRPPRAALSALVLLAVVLAAWPAASAAGFSLERFIRLGADEVADMLPRGWDRPEPPGLEGSSGSAEHWSPTQVPPAALGGPDLGALPVGGAGSGSVGLGGSDPAGAAAREPSFAAVAPVDLPLGLTRVERSAPRQDQLQLVYRNTGGLEIRLLQAPAGPGMVAMMPGAEETVTIGDIEALGIRGGRSGQEVIGLVWERAGVVFELMVVGSEAPGGPLPAAGDAGSAPNGPPAAGGALLTIEDARRIVEALAAEQDRAAPR